jgi:pyruvate dehydrogenase E1 component beta subunit
MKATFAQSIRETLTHLLREDERVLLIGEDIGRYGGAFRVTKGFLDEFSPDRIIETPISEGSFIGLAIGAALRGMKPIVEIMFMDFISLGIDQILNHGAKFPGMFGKQAEVPVVIRTPAGGGRGYGPSHSQSLESLLLSIPGISIAVPSTPQDACSLLKTAVQTPSITVFVEGKTLYTSEGDVDLDCDPLPFGQARIVKQGSDATITAFGRMVPEALKAAEFLEQKDISCELIDLRTVKPLDVDTIASSVEKTGKLVTVEESPLTGGTGGEIASRMFEQAYFSLDAPVVTVASSDVPVPASLPLEQNHIPNAEKIAQAVFSLFQSE